MKNILHLKKMQMCFISRTLKYQTMNLHINIPEVRNVEGVAEAEWEIIKYLAKVKLIFKICGVIFIFIYLLSESCVHIQVQWQNLLTRLMPIVPFTEQNVTWTLKNSRDSNRFVTDIVTRRNPVKKYCYGKQYF